MDGWSDGDCDGLELGMFEGLNDGALLVEGAPLGLMLGAALTLGPFVGLKLLSVGELLRVGPVVGGMLGAPLALGLLLKVTVGCEVGVEEGVLLGAPVGEDVGANVGGRVPCTPDVLMLPPGRSARIALNAARNGTV